MSKTSDALASILAGLPPLLTDEAMPTDEGLEMLEAIQLKLTWRELAEAYPYAC